MSVGRHGNAPVVAVVSATVAVTMLAGSALMHAARSRPEALLGLVPAQRELEKWVTSCRVVCCGVCAVRTLTDRAGRLQL